MKSLLNLDRNSPCPYYINKKKTYVLFFAEQPAILLQLLDGNLKQFEFNSDVYAWVGEQLRLNDRSPTPTPNPDPLQQFISGGN